MLNKNVFSIRYPTGQTSAALLLYREKSANTQSFVIGFLGSIRPAIFFPAYRIRRRLCIQIPHCPSIVLFGISDEFRKKLCQSVSNPIDEIAEGIFDNSPAQVIFKQGGIDMGDKGKRDIGKREQQKKAKLTPKQKRKLKREKKK